MALSSGWMSQRSPFFDTFTARALRQPLFVVVLLLVAGILLGPLPVPLYGLFGASLLLALLFILLWTSLKKVDIG